MDDVPVKLKWGKQMYNLEVNLLEPPVVLKAQIMTLTNVPLERQKLIYDRKILNNEKWPENKIKANSLLTMIGSNEPVAVVEHTTPTKSSKKNNGCPEMDDPKKVKVLGKKSPSGFQNIGNTCFMNSVFQLFRAMTPIKNFLYRNNNFYDAKDQTKQTILHHIKSALYLTEQHSKHYNVSPTLKIIISNIEKIVPEFNTVDELGKRLQQDASEFFFKVVDIIKPQLHNSLLKGNSSYQSIIETYMNIELEQSEMYPGTDTFCSHSKVNELCLSLILNQSVKDIYTGISYKFEDTIDKFDENEKRDIQVKRNYKFSRLPAYLMIQLVRFSYKTRINNAAKILKEIKLPNRLDLFDYCNEELKEKLKPLRGKINEKEMNSSRTSGIRTSNYQEFVLNTENLPEDPLRTDDWEETKIEDASVIEVPSNILDTGEMLVEDQLDESNFGENFNIDSFEAANLFNGNVVLVENDQEIVDKIFGVKTDGLFSFDYFSDENDVTESFDDSTGLLNESNNYQYELEKDPSFSLKSQNLEIGDNGSGIYFLKAILTHKGRLVNSGHYITWVRYDDKYWLKFDDDVVSLATTEQIAKLFGGGESDSAYMVIYEAFSVETKKSK